jgi:RNA polymerase sigma factor (sigma-70 family)
MDENVINDESLIQKIKEEKCENSLLQLISRHSALCFDIYQKYAPALAASGTFLDDLFKEKDYVIWKSALSYDPTKRVKYSTWLGNQVRYQCLNAINNRGHFVLLEEKDLNYHVDKKYNEEKPNFDSTLDYIFSILGQLKDKRIKEVFYLRYLESGKKMSWSKVAKKLNISTQTAINLHKKGQEMLQQKLSSKEIFDKI